MVIKDVGQRFIKSRVTTQSSCIMLLLSIHYQRYTKVYSSNSNDRPNLNMADMGPQFGIIVHKFWSLVLPDEWQLARATAVKAGSQQRLNEIRQVKLCLALSELFTPLYIYSYHIIMCVYVFQFSYGSNISLDSGPYFARFDFLKYH